MAISGSSMTHIAATDIGAMRFEAVLSTYLNSLTASRKIHCASTQTGRNSVIITEKSQARNKQTCRLTGTSGNTMSIIAAVRRALVKAKQDAAANEFLEKALACQSQDEVIQLAMHYVEVE